MPSLTHIRRYWVFSKRKCFCVCTVTFMFIRNLSVCMYVCMYVCVCAHVSIVCMYVCVCMYCVLCARLYCVCMYVCTCVCMRLYCVCVCMCVCMCVYIKKTFYDEDTRESSGEDFFTVDEFIIVDIDAALMIIIITLSVHSPKKMIEQRLLN